MPISTRIQRDVYEANKDVINKQLRNFIDVVVKKFKAMMHGSSFKSIENFSKEKVKTIPPPAQHNKKKEKITGRKKEIDKDSKEYLFYQKGRDEIKNQVKNVIEAEEEYEVLKETQKKKGIEQKTPIEVDNSQQNKLVQEEERNKENLREIYEEFWEFIEDDNEEFKEFIVSDERRKNKDKQ